MQPTDEKPASTASRVLRKGWVIGGLVLVLVAVWSVSSSAATACIG
jgi:hypothetical protein